MNTWRVAAEGFKGLVFLGLGLYLLTFAGRYHDIPDTLRNLFGAALVAYAGFKVVRLVGLLRAGRDDRMRSGDR